jgi:hypothetical protein
MAVGAKLSTFQPVFRDQHGVEIGFRSLVFHPSGGAFHQGRAATFGLAATSGIHASWRRPNGDGGDNGPFSRGSADHDGNNAGRGANRVDHDVGPRIGRSDCQRSSRLRPPPGLV